jgi:hypothetical protein
MNISVGPIVFFEKGFKDYTQNKQNIMVYVYFFESYIETDFEEVVIIDPEPDGTYWDLEFYYNNSENYTIVYKTNITNPNCFINGVYTVVAKFKEGYTLKDTVELKSGNGHYMEYPAFPVMEYDRENNKITIISYPFKTAELVFYKDTGANIPAYMGYYNIEKDKEVYLDKILDDINYNKNFSKDDFEGSIYVSLFSSTHSDSDISKLKLKEWNKVYQVYSKFIEVEF